MWHINELVIVFGLGSQTQDILLCVCKPKGSKPESKNKTKQKTQKP